MNYLHTCDVEWLLEFQLIGPPSNTFIPQSNNKTLASQKYKSRWQTCYDLKVPFMISGGSKPEGGQPIGTRLRLTISESNNVASQEC